MQKFRRIIYKDIIFFYQKSNYKTIYWQVDYEIHLEGKTGQIYGDRQITLGGEHTIQLYIKHITELCTWSVYYFINQSLQ